MTTTTMTLCRITTAEAQHLMMAPSVAGGWAAVDQVARIAVERVLDGSATILALLPSSWEEASRPVEDADALKIAEILDRSTALGGRMGAAAEELAGRIRGVAARGR